MKRRVRSAFVRGLAVCKCWNRRYRQRRQLLTLDEHMLKDIGLNRAAAQLEGNKPFWRQ